MTSLADQLRRLQAPQTSILTDRKTRVSILFDPKEAALKDRETIFDIGYSGLKDLIVLNPTFMQFESTLFDKNARDMQRAVENREVNLLLDETIKKFLVHLSPYLLLQSTHKCLEWLIRRFNINEYNKDELMMLILPYHETKIFVKCLQTMRLAEPNDKWHWLNKIQNPGVPLSKQALLTRVANDDFLLNFICESIVYATGELQSKSNSLQIFYAFFCTSIIGAFELRSPNESQITHVYRALRKGLKSTSVDFCAASMMIIGQIVTRTKLSSKLLETFITRLLKIQHTKLQNDSVVLLILIYRNQSEIIGEIPSNCIFEIIHSKWIINALIQLHGEGVNILPLFVPLLAGCLRAVQLSRQNLKPLKHFSGALLSEISFSPEEAASVIRCTLNSFILPEKPLKESVITIDSENEDDDTESNQSSAKFRNWYTQLLKSLERRYSITFDAIVKEIIGSKNPNINDGQKKKLKTVLGFLFTIVCTDDNANLFEKLHHHNPQYRVEALKYLSRNLAKMSFSDDSKGLLQSSIVERLTDDSPTVVREALKFDTRTLSKIVDKQLEKKLCLILERTLEAPNVWESVAHEVLKHITSSTLCTRANAINVFVAVLPYLLQANQFDVSLLHEIFNSTLTQFIPFVSQCSVAVGSKYDKKEIHNFIVGEFESKKGLPNVERTLIFIKSIPDENLTVHKGFYSMLLISYAIDSTTSAKAALEILELIKHFEQRFNLTHVKSNKKWMAQVALGQYPVNLNVETIKNIIDNGNLFKKMDTCMPLIHKILEYLVSGMQNNQHSHESKFHLYSNATQLLFDKIMPTVEDCINFLSNYFVMEFFDADQNENCVKLNAQQQIYAANLISKHLAKCKNITDAKIDFTSFIKMLSGLRSSASELREIAFNTFIILSQCKSKYSSLIGKLLKRRDEILTDENQISLILFTIFRESSKEIKEIMNNVIVSLENRKLNENQFLIALTLELLTHINTERVLCAASTICSEILSLNQSKCQEKGKISHNTKCVVTLDKYQSAIVENVLYRLTANTIKWTKKHRNIWNLIVESIRSFSINLKQNNGKITSIANMIIGIFNEELFMELNKSDQHDLLCAIVTSVTYSENVDLSPVTNKFLRQIEIDAKICIELFDKMAHANDNHMDVDNDDTSLTQSTVTQPSSTKRASNVISSNFEISSPVLLKAPAWKCGVTWLEFLQNKLNVKKTHLLIGPLFNVLQKCLEFEDQSNVEYAKQLILACILNSCEKLMIDKSRNEVVDSVFKVELVVKCIRGTQNPQTHHHALQLLAFTAKLLPEQVLHNMMDIFTFMGSSVVRHDDAYSFQIIKNVVTSIIPTLIKMNETKTETEKIQLVVPVLKVFSDILLDVPEHRRQPLYVKLIETLGPQQFLWMFLAVLFDSHVVHEEQDNQTKSNRNKSELPKRIEIALALIKEFSCDTIIMTSSKLIQFLTKLPLFKPTMDETNKISVEILSIIDVNAVTSRHLRHYKYTIVTFISTLTSSTDFVNKIARLDEWNVKPMKAHYQDAIISILTLIPEVSKAAEQDASHVTYWKALLHHCYDILENVISLLAPNTLLVVVEGLLDHKLPSVRRKVIEMLINKLQYKTEFFAESDQENLLRLLDPLTNIIESIVDKSKQTLGTSVAETVSTQQMSLLAMKLLSKLLGQKYPEKFTKVLEILIDVLEQSDEVPRILLATVLLCLAEICANLRAHSIVHLPSFMKIFLDILKRHASNTTINSDTVLISLISATLKIVGTLPLFMSPYLVDLIVNLCQIWDRVVENTERDGKQETIVQRLAAIWEKLSNTLQLRILLPTIDQSYQQIKATGDACGVGPLLLLLSQTFDAQTAANITPFMSDITEFFARILQIRGEFKDKDLNKINSLEDKFIKAFVSLTLKLSEGSFRPLYCHIFDWTFNDFEQSPNIDRLITFYRLSNELAKSLKSLYVLFANDVTQNATEILVKVSQNAIDASNESKNEKAKMTLLLTYTLETLHQIFLHGDSHGFINGNRFEMLLEPLTGQIENELIVENETLKCTLSTCIGQFGIAANDDILWKQLNYKILMKTRNNQSSIRLFALKICVEFASKLGEDYMSLLPETIPFLAELLEDENAEVEKECQHCVQELETVLGEPLQKYF